MIIIKRKKENKDKLLSYIIIEKNNPSFDIVDTSNCQIF